MKKIIGIFLALTLVITLILSGCGTTTAPTTLPPATTVPTGTTTPPTTPISNEAALKIAEDFIENSSTFKFDGVEGSIKLIKFEKYTPISSFRASQFIFEFQTAHPGHGDRTGQILAEVITNHTVDTYVDIDKGTVRIAACDKTWDMIRDRIAPTAVSGIVVSGGDTAQPGGPMDVPHKFVYEIKKSDGTTVKVSYTAYPPSPVGDAQRAKITLDFHGGSINIGDKMDAFGTLDKETNTVIVAEQGDFIKTYPQ